MERRDGKDGRKMGQVFIVLENGWFAVLLTCLSMVVMDS